MTVPPGGLRLEGIHLVLASDDAPKALARRWAAFAIRPGTADLSMTDCTVTIEGVAHTSAVVAILPVDPPRRNASRPSSRPPATRVRIKNSLFRVGEDLVDVAPGRSVDLDVDNAAIATGGTLVHGHGLPRGKPAGPIKVTLPAATARLAGGLPSPAVPSAAPSCPSPTSSPATRSSRPTTPTPPSSALTAKATSTSSATGSTGRAGRSPTTRSASTDATRPPSPGRSPPASTATPGTSPSASGTNPRSTATSSSRPNGTLTARPGPSASTTSDSGPRAPPPRPGRGRTSRTCRARRIGKSSLGARRMTNGWTRPGRPIGGAAGVTSAWGQSIPSVARRGS